MGRRRYGTARDAAKLTYETALESILHEADGYQHQHQHHLAADDGALYEPDRRALAGGEFHTITLLTPVQLDRLQDTNGHYYLRLTLAGDCAYGGQLTVSYDLRKTDLNRDGHLPWRSLVAKLCVIPDALVERFGEVSTAMATRSSPSPGWRPASTARTTTRAVAARRSCST